MCNKRRAKHSLREFRNWAYVVCMGMAALLLVGCAMIFGPTATPAPAIAEEPQEEIQATPVPEPVNPLKAFLNGFYEVYTPCDDALNALMEQDNAAVDEALAAARHIQRLRQLFDAQAGLLVNPYDPSTWDGILFGGMEGTGSVTRTADGCVFSCTLTNDMDTEDGTNTISGSLKGNLLFGEWVKQDGSICSGTILKTKTGYCAYVNWAGESTMMLVEDGVLSYGVDVETPSTASSLQQGGTWVNWYLQQGALVEHTADTTVSSQEETE